VTSFEIQDDEVIVLGKLSADEITKMQFGSSTISHRKDGSIISVGEAVKAGATDCLKKCATLMGVALHLYSNDGGNGSDESGNNGRTNNRLTNAQLKAIFAIARAQKMTNKAVNDLSKEKYGHTVNFLNKQEASQLIQQLQNAEEVPF
jgi:hypothetical protein